MGGNCRNAAKAGQTCNEPFGLTGFENHPSPTQVKSFPCGPQTPLNSEHLLGLTQPSPPQGWAKCPGIHCRPPGSSITLMIRNQEIRGGGSPMPAQKDQGGKEAALFSSHNTKRPVLCLLSSPEETFSNEEFASKWLPSKCSRSLESIFGSSRAEEHQ